MLTMWFQPHKKLRFYNRLFFCQLSRVRPLCTVRDALCVPLLCCYYWRCLRLNFFFWFFTWCLLLQLFLLYFVQPNNYLTSYDPNHLKHKMKWLSFDLETFLMDCMSFCLHFFSIVRKTICWDLDFFTFNMKKQCFFLSQTLYFAIQFYFWKEHDFMLVYFGIVFFYKCLANSKVSSEVCHKRSCC